MIDKVNEVLNHATMDDYEQIMDVFKLHKAYFPHIRGDKIRRMIDDQNVVWEDGVLITWNRYKRKQRVGTYEAQKGDCILHQIAARDQGNGSAKKVFEKFIHNGNEKRDVLLSVRSENKRARAFYEKYGFKIVSDIEWGKTKQVKGKVYLLEQKPYYEGYYD
tara:strand:+ start:219 stop:704 length:486 start_codon:yes stop_codon:yes gene_type:complete